MQTMTKPAAVAPATETPRLTSLGAVCLVGAPLVAVVARLVGTPWLEDPGEYLSEVSSQTGQSDLGAELTLLSALLFIPAVFALAAIVGGSRRRLAGAGRALGAVGAVGLAAVACVSLVAGQMARLDDPETTTALWERIIDEPPLQVFALMLAAGAVGMIVLAVGLYRSRAVPRAAAVLAGLGRAATMVTAGAPVQAVIVAVAVVATVAFAWIAVTVEILGKPSGGQ